MAAGIGHDTSYFAWNVLGEEAVGEVLQLAHVFVRVIGDVHFTDLEKQGERLGEAHRWLPTLSIHSLPTMMLLTMVVTFLHVKWLLVFLKIKCE